MAVSYLYETVALPKPQESYKKETSGMLSTPFVCQTDTAMFAAGEVYKAIEKVTDPIVATTWRDVVDYDSPAANNLRSGNRVVPIYFGSMILTPEVVPPPTVMSSQRWREKPKSKRKNWERAKKRGDIVFKPIKTGSYTAVSNPGLDPKYRAASSTRVTWNRTMDSFMPLGTGLCTTSLKRMAMPDEKVRSSISANIEVFQDKTRYSETRFLYLEDIYPGVSEAIHKFVMDITPQREVCFDRGLSTSVICEANAGAWDIATEIAEGLRETIPSIVKACAHIVRKYLEVRKKIKVLRKNAISESTNLATLKADIAALWLNFRYGIGPLAYTIQDGLAYFEHEQQKYQTYRDGMSKEYKFEHDDLVGSVKVTHRCVVRDLFDPNLLGRYNTSGLKINFWDTLWQIAPASFMIDWVVNVGDVLTTLVEPDGLKTRKWMYSVRCRDTLVLTSPRLPGGSITVAIDCYTASTSVREPVGLQFNPNMSPKRWLDALAIFWGGVKKPLQYR